MSQVSYRHRLEDFIFDMQKIAICHTTIEVTVRASSIAPESAFGQFSHVVVDLML